MLRRFAVSSGVALSSASLHPHAASRRVASSSSVGDSQTQQAREDALRQEIVAKYKIHLPRITEFTYAKFASSAASSNSAGGPQSAAQDAFKRFFSSSSAPSSGSDNSQNGQQKQQKQGQPGAPEGIDWLMLLTGSALVVATSQLLMDRMSGPTSGDGLVVPLWELNYADQARYLLFLVSADKFTRDQLQQEFERTRAAGYPLLSFFDWIEQRYPAYGAGRKYPKSVGVDMLSTTLQSASSFQLAAVGRLATDSIGSHSGADPQGKVDDFLDKLDRIVGGSAAAKRAAPPAAAGYGGYGGYMTPPAGYAVPQQGGYPGGYVPPSYPSGFGLPPPTVSPPMTMYPQQQQQQQTWPPQQQQEAAYQGGPGGYQGSPYQGLVPPNHLLTPPGMNAHQYAHPYGGAGNAHLHHGTQDVSLVDVLAAVQTQGDHGTNLDALIATPSPAVSVPQPPSAPAHGTTL